MPTAIDFETLNLILIPVVAALIGWGTNTIAVKMLFRPRRQVSILGFKLQGLVPRRQMDLANKIAQTVERDLISHKDVQAVIQSPETQAEIEKLIQQQISTFISEKLAFLPLVSAFLQGETAQQINALLVKQFRDAIPDLLQGLVDKVEHKMDFQQIVRSKVEAFDLGRLEQIIYDISAKELKTIEYLGGVLGFIVGLAQVGLMLLAKL